MKKKNYSKTSLQKRMETDTTRSTKNYIRRMYEQFEAEKEIEEWQQENITESTPERGITPTRNEQQ
jgi:hypothetical protein